MDEQQGSSRCCTVWMVPAWLEWFGCWHKRSRQLSQPSNRNTTLCRCGKESLQCREQRVKHTLALLGESASSSLHQIFDKSCVHSCISLQLTRWSVGALHIFGRTAVEFSLFQVSVCLLFLFHQVDLKVITFATTSPKQNLLPTCFTHLQ